MVTRQQQQQQPYQSLRGEPRRVSVAQVSAEFRVGQHQAAAVSRHLADSCATRRKLPESTDTTTSDTSLAIDPRAPLLLLPWPSRRGPAAMATRADASRAKPYNTVGEPSSQWAVLANGLPGACVVSVLGHPLPATIQWGLRHHSAHVRVPRPRRSFVHCPMSNT